MFVEGDLRAQRPKKLLGRADVGELGVLRVHVRVVAAVPEVEAFQVFAVGEDVVTNLD